jgi:hypothetical protein
MSTTDTPKQTVIELPEFKMSKVVEITIPATTVILTKQDGWFDVAVKGQFGTTTTIGDIFRDGTGFRAEFNYGESRGSFHGDRFPKRTGKHTRQYALMFLVAMACGFTQGDATYNLKGEGISA